MNPFLIYIFCRRICNDHTELPPAFVFFFYVLSSIDTSFIPVMNRSMYCHSISLFHLSYVNKIDEKWWFCYRSCNLCKSYNYDNKTEISAGTQGLGSIQNSHMIRYILSPERVVRNMDSPSWRALSPTEKLSGLAYLCSLHSREWGRFSLVLYFTCLCLLLFYILLSRIMEKWNLSSNYDYLNVSGEKNENICKQHFNYYFVFCYRIME